MTKTTKFYTLWTKHGDDDAIIIEDFPLTTKRKTAFDAAEALAKNLIGGSGDVILVRLVSLDSTKCTEWVFE